MNALRHMARLGAGPVMRSTLRPRAVQQPAQRIYQIRHVVASAGSQGPAVSSRFAGRRCFTSASFAKSPSVDELITEGNNMIEQGRPERAIECYVDAIAEKGETPGLLYNLGSAYCQAGRITDAMVALRKSLEHDPDQPDALVNLANLYAAEGDQREAIKLYKRALELREDDAQCHHNLGLMYNKMGNWSAAVAELKRSRDLDPSLSMEPLKYALIRMMNDPTSRA